MTSSKRRGKVFRLPTFSPPPEVEAWIPTWDQPELVVDGVHYIATWETLLELCGPPPDPTLESAVRAAVAAELANHQPPSSWLTREQAARHLGCGLRTFDASVRPKLPHYRLTGAAVRFKVCDLDRWLDTRKAGGSGSRKVARHTSCGSDATGSELSDPQARAIRSRLNVPRKESTQTRSSEPPNSDK
jgi:excisionase family DNA binding protein